VFSNTALPTLLCVFSCDSRSTDIKPQIHTFNVVLCDDILLLYLDHDIVVDAQLPLMHLVRAEDQLPLVLEEEGGAQSIMQGCLL
jgi:hypothetical protein